MFCALGWIALAALKDAVADATTDAAVEAKVKELKAERRNKQVAAPPTPDVMPQA